MLFEFKKWRLTFAEKHMKTFFSGAHIKKDFHDPCGSKYVGNSRTKTYRAYFWKFGQKSFESQIIACSYTSAWAQLEGFV